MYYGNCLWGMFVLMGVLRQRWRLVVCRSAHGWVPHFFLRGEDGWLYHFRLVSDILPFPFYYLVFRGEFVRCQTPTSHHQERVKVR